MKILHIVHPDPKFCKIPALFLNSWLDITEHSILYINYIGRNSLLIKDIDICQKEIFLRNKADVSAVVAILNEMKKYDYVVLHSLFLNLIIKLGIFINNNIISKLIWIEFGGDLYTSQPKGFLDRVTQHIVNKIANGCFAFVAIFQADCNYFADKYPLSKARVFYAPYWGPVMPEVYNKINNNFPLNKKIVTKEEIVIQIGNNGNEQFKHIETLNAIARFKNENIRILLILSYGGSENYRNMVQAHAEKLFPGKVTCLRELVSAQEYFSIINNVDICIFNTYRQRGLGNIYRMIWNNVKLFMPKDSIMYKYFCSRGVPIQCYDDIFVTSFGSFIETPKIEDIEKLNEFKREFSSMERCVKCWRNIYDYLRNSVKHNVT